MKQKTGFAGGNFTANKFSLLVNNQVHMLGIPTSAGNLYNLY